MMSQNWETNNWQHWRCLTGFIYSCTLST